VSGCARCAWENAPGARFCAGCGAPLTNEPGAAREERKVVTVLFADLVGFTSRSERLDPEDVRATLSPYYARLRGELERFGGTVEKFIGDAVMAVFGAPVAHEDDAERGVRAALAIREAMADDERGLEVRIGVNTGEALVTLGARPEEGEGIVAGDVVNTAARIQAAAAPNTILVGEQTKRSTRSRIEYREVEPVQGKGKAEPIPVWEVVQATARLGVDVMQRTRAPLIGRDSEREVLVSALERVREERSAQLVTLVAAPGLGKSRLVRELLAAVEESPDLIFWRQGGSLPYGDGITYWALGEIVKAQAGILETDDAETAAAKLAAAVASAAPDDPDAQWLEGHLRPLVGLGGDLEAQGDRRSEAFAAWRRFLEALAEQRPLVLVFEDLQWADNGLLDFVDHLVDWSSGVPLLVVTAARPELLDRRPGWGGGKRNAVTLSLSPLSETETARLIAALLDQPVLPAETQATLLARAGGNPLYAEEYARTLAEGPVTESQIPETLQGVIAARLDLLSAQEKAVVQDAAAIGKVFWLGALAALGQEPSWQIEERMHALERKEFVRRERRSSVESDVEFSFLHVLIRDVAYGQIPRAERARRHLAVAAWIEQLGRPEDSAEMLAHHYLSALEYARAAVVEHPEVARRAGQALGEAGARAAALNSFEAADRFTRAALDFVEHGSQEWSRLAVQRMRVAQQSSMVSSRQLFEDTRAELEAAGYPEAAAEAGTLESWSAWVAGNVAAASSAIEHASALLEEAPPSRAKAAVLSRYSRLLAIGGAGEEAADMAEKAVAMATDLGLADLRAEALNNRGMARMNVGDTTGFDDLEQSIELARRAGSLIDVSRGLGNLASFLFGDGEVARASELHETALAHAERYGLEGGILWPRAERVEFDYHAGRWDDSLAGARDWLAALEGGQRHFIESNVRCVRSQIFAARGDLAGALAEDDLQLELARTLDPQAADPSLAVSAFVRALAGERTGAGQRIDELLRRWRDHRMTPTFNPSDLAFATVLVDLADSFLAAASQARPTRWLAAATAFARGEYAEAARLFEEIGSAPNAAYARLRGAEALVAAGLRTDADGELNQAVAFYRSVGARLFLRTAEELLAAAG